MVSNEPRTPGYEWVESDNAPDSMCLTLVSGVAKDTVLGRLGCDPSTRHIVDFVTAQREQDHTGDRLVVQVETVGDWVIIVEPNGYLGATAVASASALFDTTIDAWAVSYALTPSGSRAWDQVVQANFHQHLAVDVDGLVESAPLIPPDQSVFSSFGGKGEISGNLTAASAKALAAMLASGSLVAPLHPVSGK